MTSEEVRFFTGCGDEEVPPQSQPQPPPKPRDPSPENPFNTSSIRHRGGGSECVLPGESKQQSKWEPQQPVPLLSTSGCLDSKDDHYDHYDKDRGYKELPRLVPRNVVFDQSKNTVRVYHNHHLRIFWLLRHDWYHAFLRAPTLVSAFVLLSIWTFMIIVFALIYVAIDQKDPLAECGLGASGKPIAFGPAFSFSLETCTTVGYGLPNSVNSFFESNCVALVITIYFQMVWSMMFNAFLFAFFYNRLGRSESRGAQVVMSKNAIVNLSHPDGQVRFQVRIFDIDASHPVVEAHVRLYVVNKNRPVPRPLRVLQPDDELGAVLVLSLPTVVTHHVDVYSMLHPPTEDQPLHPCGLVLRQSDSHVTSRDEHICPVCAESYGTHDRWVRHVRYTQMIERKEGYPVEESHLCLTEDDLLPPRSPTTNLEELRDYFRRELSEVVCVVEAIDPLTSGTFQALQSYKFEDIVWDARAQFAPCLTVDKREHFVVDLDTFHEITHTTSPAPSVANNSNHNNTSATTALAPSATAAAPTNNTPNAPRPKPVRKPQRSVRVHDALAEDILANNSGSPESSMW